MDYIFHIVVLIGVYTTLAVSLDLLVGQTGILSVAHGAFYGIGAYTSAVLSVNLGCPFLLGVLVGMIASALVSIAVALPSLRVHEDYFVIATFGFQVIVFSMFNNWMELTHGPIGIPGIPRPSVFGWTIQSPIAFVALACVLAAFAYLVIDRISRSPFGRVLRAIREDEVFAQALGKNTLRFKVIAFAVSAAFAASAGSLYAHYVSYVDPSSFGVMESILVIAMVIVGGAGSRWGPLVGSVILVILPEALRFVGLPSSVAAHTRQVIYGTLLVVMMLFRPRGLVGRYGFDR
jgi:branched-chain amino acid transport system permease protein